MTDVDTLEQLFILPADATLVPLAKLSPRVRATLGPLDDGDGQVAVSRERYRVPTRLVTRELAALLAEFRQPSRIVDAVLRFSQADERDPFDTLDHSFDALALFINGNVLVPADSTSADGLVPTFGPGELMGAYEVERLVCALVDTEVYLARDRAGAQVALKLARPDASAAVTDSVAGEAEILRHLGGGISPALIEQGNHDGRPFLALEWRAGVPVTVAAQRARAARHRLHSLCANVLAAYAWLHERDVVHGDLHPGNLIVGDDDAVTVLDFGRSRLLTLPVAAPDPGRAGVAYFYEPELAVALRAGTLPPAATRVGEQYALAALLYHLITGVHYVDFSAELDMLLDQVADRPPLPFTARGLEPWPAVEAVLAKALAKDPAERFGDVAELRAAFLDAGAEPRRPAPERSAAADRLVADAVALARATADAASVAPASARDLAWFALRAAQVRDDPDLLAAADIWACRAARGGEADWALEAITAHIHHARGDAGAQARSAQALLAACERAGDDVGGALVAAARVLEGMRDSEADTGPLADWIRHTAGKLWQEGDAALLYATLYACRATATPPPAGLAARLEESRDPLLWALAHEAFGDRRSLELAESCVGGRGFALLRLYQLTGKSRWLVDARRLAHAAADTLLLIELEAPECAVLPIRLEGACRGS